MMKQVKAADLPLRTLDPNSPIPLYHQIEADLRELIKTGQLAPSDVLPPEIELSQGYGVGRHTMRMALSRLVADNLIARKAGRGTFVKARPDRTRFYLDRSFTRQMADMGLAARSHLLEINHREFEKLLPEYLRRRGPSGYFPLARLRFGGNEPVGIQYTAIVREQCPGLDRFNFEQNSLYDILSKEYHLDIRQITHTVSAVTATDDQADLLRVTAGDPLLLVNTRAFLENNRLIEFTASFYRADKYEYSTTHTIPSLAYEGRT